MINDAQTEHCFMQAQEDCLETLERSISRRVMTKGCTQKEAFAMIVEETFGKNFTEQHAIHVLQENYGLDLENQEMVMSLLG